MKPMKLKTIIFLTILGERTLLGAFAWDHQIAAWLDNIINFPFGAMENFLDWYLWNTYGPSHWLTDEITSGFFPYNLHTANMSLLLLDPVVLE